MPKINPTEHLLAMMSDTTALARMDAQTLADEMNKAVRSALKSATESAIVADELEAQYLIASEALAAAINDGMNEVPIYEDGKPAAYPIDDFRKRVAELESKATTAITAANQYNEDFTKYMETQMAMFRSKGLPPIRAYKEMIIGVGEMKKPNGETLQLMRIIKRDCDLEPVEVDEETKDRSAAARIAFSYSGAVGMAKEEKRGKYNDAAMLINGEAANIDRSEYAQWAAM